MKQKLYLGPCSIESKDQISKVIEFFKNKNIDFVLRGGIFKMRTSSDSFQGLHQDGVDLMREIVNDYQVNYACEVASESQVEQISDFVSIYQVGTRSMYNYELLKYLNSKGKPVILKRGFSATLDEWIKASKYLSNVEVTLCERGVRSFDNTLRNSLDLAGAMWVKQNTPYQIIVDPSHATGNRSLIYPMAKAAVAAGLDGLMIECHPEPDKSISDKEQAISLEDTANIIEWIKKYEELG